MKNAIFSTLGVVGVTIFVAVAMFFYLISSRSEGHYFDSEGVRLFYSDTGSGEPVILVHGLGVNGDWNWGLTGVSRELEKDFRVIIPDLRGHGLSDKPDSGDAYGTHMVEDIVRLMDHLNIEKAHFAGFSLGGAIVLKLMEEHPERVRTAALCAIGWIEPSADFVVPEPYRGINASGSTFAGMVHTVRRMIARHTSRDVLNKIIMESMKDLAVSEEMLRQNKTDTLLMVGTEDGFYEIAGRLAERTANMKYVRVEGANHFTLVLREAFRKNIVRFFHGD